MARGFESKDVEFQQSEAERAKTRGPALTPAEAARAEKRRTLELAASQARAQLAVARSPAHRRMLEDAIRSLEDQLASHA